MVTFGAPQPLVPVGIKPTPGSFGGPGTIPGNLWNGMKACWPMWETVGMPRELLTGVEATQGTGMDWGVGQHGVGLLGTSGSDDNYIDTNLTQDDIGLDIDEATNTEGVTVFAAGYTRSTGTSQNTILGWRDNTGGTGGAAFIISGSGDASRGSIITWGVATTLATQDWTVDPAVSATRGFSPFLFELNHRDGVSVFQDRGMRNTAALSGANNDDSSRNLFIGATNNNGAGAFTEYMNTSRLDVLYIWQRLLDDAEKEVMLADPFAPLRSYYRVPLGETAAGGGTILPMVMQYMRAGR